MKEEHRLALKAVRGFIFTGDMAKPMRDRMYNNLSKLMSRKKIKKEDVKTLKQIRGLIYGMGIVDSVKDRIISSFDEMIYEGESSEQS